MKTTHEPLYAPNLIANIDFFEKKENKLKKFNNIYFKQKPQDSRKMYEVFKAQTLLFI